MGSENSKEKSDQEKQPQQQRPAHQQLSPELDQIFKEAAKGNIQQALDFLKLSPEKNAEILRKGDENCRTLLSRLCVPIAVALRASSVPVCGMHSNNTIGLVETEQELSTIKEKWEASEHARLQCAKTLLLDHPELAAINDVDVYGLTALGYACSRNSMYVMLSTTYTRLFKSGGNDHGNAMKTIDKNNINTRIVKLEPSPDFIELFLLEGADPNLCGETASAPIHLACTSLFPKAVGELLATNKVSPSTPSKRKDLPKTPLSFVAMYAQYAYQEEDSIACAELLIASGADISDGNRVRGQQLDFPPLVLAVKQKNVPLVKYLIKSGCEFLEFGGKSKIGTVMQQREVLACPETDPEIRSLFAPYKVKLSNTKLNTNKVLEGIEKVFHPVLDNRWILIPHSPPSQQRITEALHVRCPDLLKVILSGGHSTSQKMKFRSEAESGEKFVEYSPLQFAALFKVKLEGSSFSGHVRAAPAHCDQMAILFCDILLRNGGASPLPSASLEELPSSPLVAAVCNEADSRALVQLMTQQQETKSLLAQTPQMQEFLLSEAIKKNHFFVAEYLINTLKFSAHRQTNEAYDKFLQLIYIAEVNKHEASAEVDPQFIRHDFEADVILKTDAEKLRLLSYLFPPRSVSKKAVFAPLYCQSQIVSVTAENFLQQPSSSKITIKPLQYFSTLTHKQRLIALTQTQLTHQTPAEKDTIINSFIEGTGEEEQQLRTILKGHAKKDENVYHEPAEYLCVLRSRLRTHFAEKRPVLLENEELMEKAIIAALNEEALVFANRADAPDDDVKLKNLALETRINNLLLFYAPDEAYDFMYVNKSAQTTEAHLKTLITKFGPEQQQPTAAPIDLPPPTTKERLTVFFQKYAPEKLQGGTIEKILEKYKGQENQLFETLVQKYGPEPPAVTQAPKERLTAFYQKYAPEKLQGDTIMTLLERWKGQEEQMFSALVAKYGPEPPLVAQTSVSKFNSSLNDAVLGNTAVFGSHFPPTEKEIVFTFSRLERFFYAEFKSLFLKYDPDRVAHLPNYLLLTRNQFNMDLESFDKAKERKTSLLTEFYYLFKFYSQTLSSSSSSSSSSLSTPQVDKNNELQSLLNPLLSGEFGEKESEEKLSQLKDLWFEASFSPQEEVFPDLVLEKSRKIVFGSDHCPTLETGLTKAMSDHQSMKERLKRFFEKYNPEKLTQIDVILTKYCGCEEELINTLKRKYGPEPAVHDAELKEKIEELEKKRMQNTIFDDSSSDDEEQTDEDVLNELLGVASPLKHHTKEEDIKISFKSSSDQHAMISDSGNKRISQIIQTSTDAEELESFSKENFPDFAGREKELLEKAISKFGSETFERCVEPDFGRKQIQVAVSSKMKQRLNTFLLAKSKESLQFADELLVAYAGKEDELFQLLERKYGPFSSSPSSDFKTRLTNFYTKYNPEKLRQLDAILESCKGTEDRTIQMLVAKYGPEPENNVESEYKTRLTNIYKKYAPSKLEGPLVDRTIQKFKGHEEEMFKALVAKYGPEPKVPDKDDADDSSSATTDTVTLIIYTKHPLSLQERTKRLCDSWMKTDVIENRTREEFDSLVVDILTGGDLDANTRIEAICKRLGISETHPPVPLRSFVMPEIEIEVENGAVLDVEIVNSKYENVVDRLILEVRVLIKPVQSEDEDAQEKTKNATADNLMDSRPSFPVDKRFSFLCAPVLSSGEDEAVSSDGMANVAALTTEFSL